MSTGNEPLADLPAPPPEVVTKLIGSFVVRDLEEYDEIVARLHEDHLRAA
jgi:hypothetical protein